LTQTGLLVSRLSEVGGTPIQQRARIQQGPSPSIQQGPAAPAPVRPVSPAAPPIVRPIPNATPANPAARQAPASRPQTSPVPAARAAPPHRQPIRTKAGTDKDLYFIFSQLQSYAHAGLNPVEAYTNVANGCRRQDYGNALRQAADAAKEGRPMSDVFERYVDLFPPHVAGMVRAAEHGGFFPEAYDLITDQAHASHRFRIWFKWLLAVTIMVAGCIPIMILMRLAGLQSWDVQDRTGGQAPGWGTLFSSVGHQFIWPWGPITAILVIASIFFAKWWQSMPNRERRHRFVLRTPSIAKRARAESLSVFAWSLGKLSNVGLPPRTVWELATGTIPNLELRRQMDQTGQRMSERTKLSEAMTMSAAVPQEYAPIVQTGEITGDVPGALMRASQSQLEEFKAGDQGSKARVGCWMLLLIFIGSAAIFALFYGWFYPVLFKKILGE
ncbi:MAG TPA: type II secretion system F family protein, partial [Fimbriimonadaceae bacterium]|nr:type II secretion system F family protein [Fimbriimonadaceae bacterium]